MLRLFKLGKALGPKSTATKIIYSISDIFFKCPEYEQHEDIFSSRTGSIENLTVLVDTFAKAILDVIDYTKYKQQTVDIKDKIKKQIANSLFEAAKHYETKCIVSVRVEYHLKEQSHKEYYRKGITASIEKVYTLDHERYEYQCYPIMIHFLKKLFLNKKLLSEHIYFTPERDYADIINADYRYGGEEVKKNTIMLAQSYRTKTGMFFTLPREISGIILSLTAENKLPKEAKDGLDSYIQNKI